METKIITASINCPICDGRLRGNHKLGYRCSGCKSVFTAKQVMWLSKHHLRTIINKSFSPEAIDEYKEITISQNKQVRSIEENSMIIAYDPIDKKIAASISQTQDAAQASKHHLEEILDAQQDAKETIEETKRKLLEAKKKLEEKMAKLKAKQEKKNSK